MASRARSNENPQALRPTVNFKGETNMNRDSRTEIMSLAQSNRSLQAKSNTRSRIWSRFTDM